MINREVHRKHLWKIVILSAFLLLLVGMVCAEEEIHGQKSEEQKAERFNPGTFIFEHVADAYTWHIFSIQHKDGQTTEVAIPLPVILYSRYSGFHVFLSSRFEHGHATYHNFSIGHEGANKGKIVEHLPDGTEVRPLDFSITKNVVAIFVSVALMLWVFLSVARAYQKNPNQPPRGLQSALEPFILFIRDDIARPLIGEKKYERFMPYLLTLFFFIWINNMLGLIPIFPGGANVTGNIAVTMVLALFTFVITSVSGNRDYWMHMVNMPGVPWWLKIPLPLMPFIEIMGMFTKPFVLMVRLFANILAGHIIALGFFSLIFIFGEMHPAFGYGISLISILFTVFMGLLELLVALIQAYVFTLLSALYFGMATSEHAHEEHS